MPIKWRTREAPTGGKWEVGKTVTGKFGGVREYGADRMRVVEVRCDDGQRLCLDCPANLQAKLEGVPAGTLIRIHCNGGLSPGPGEVRLSFRVDEEDRAI